MVIKASAAVFVMLLTLSFRVTAAPSQAEDFLMMVPAVQRVDTRDGVNVPIFTYWRNDAVATVVLFSGRCRRLWSDWQGRLADRWKLSDPYR